MLNGSSLGISNGMTIGNNSTVEDAPSSSGNTLSGAISLSGTGNFVVDSSPSDVMTLSGAITSSGTLNKNGAGTLQIADASANTNLAGTISVNNGAIRAQQ